MKFQFPSNGKVHGKNSETRRPVEFKMFQFPSNGKVHGKREDELENFLKSIEFQFPSNGKVHGKFWRPHGTLERLIVSIPFKREGTWKENVDLISSMHAQFQFPSNGKVHGKSC